MPAAAGDMGMPAADGMAEDISLVQIQIDSAINEAQLTVAGNKLGGDTAKKLTKLKEEITKVLGDDKTKEQVNNIIDSVQKMTVPAVETIPDKEFKVLKKAADTFAKSTKDAKALEDWEKAQDAARKAAMPAAKGRKIKK